MARLGTVRGIKRRCTELRASVLRDRAATEDEIAAYWAGGEENPDTTLDGWIFCYASLVRFMGRTEPRREDAQLDAAIARQLAAQPIEVPMVDGTSRAVYPKSYHALRFLDALDRDQVLVATTAHLADVGTTAGATQAMVAPLVESLAVRLWAWILTDSRRELPFDDSGEMPEPPKWTKSLTTDDIYAIARGHIQVNFRDLRTIAAAFPADPANAESRLTLAGFLGTASEALGARPFEVMRKWSLGEVFAQRVTAAEAARAASAKSQSAA